MFDIFRNEIEKKTRGFCGIFFKIWNRTKMFYVLHFYFKLCVSYNIVYTCQKNKTFRYTDG